jgi:hypothetical protein
MLHGEAPAASFAPTQLPTSVTVNSGDFELVMLAIVSEPLPVTESWNDELSTVCPTAVAGNS